MCLSNHVLKRSEVRESMYTPITIKRIPWRMGTNNPTIPKIIKIIPVMRAVIFK